MEGYLDPNHWHTSQLVDTLQAAANELQEMQAISLLKPKFFKDGDTFCFQYGESADCEIVGRGETAALAMSNFHSNFYRQKATGQ